MKGHRFDPSHCHHPGCTATPERYLHLGVPAMGAKDYKASGIGIMLPHVFCAQHLLEQRPSQYLPKWKATLEQGAAQTGVVCLDYSRTALHGRQIGDKLWQQAMELSVKAEGGGLA